MEQLQLERPVAPYWINQKFGDNFNDFYRQLGMLGHNGLDLMAADGAFIRAAHEGIVTFCGEDGSGGLGVVIRTTKTYEYKGQQVYFKTIYWHIKTSGFLVKAGDIVKPLQPIALADNTGMSTDSHLHFGLKPVVQGEHDWQWYNIEQDAGYLGAIDPLPFIKRFDYTFTKRMTYLQRNEDIKKFQYALKILGYFPYDQECTGFYGSITKSAAYKLQLDYFPKAHNYGISAGPLTLARTNILML